MPAPTVCLSFDVDAMSVWFGYERTTPAMLQRGEYGIRVGMPRILRLLDEQAIKATFFIPGHTVESYPGTAERVLEAGHEVGHHSWAHQDPSTQAADDERADFERAMATFAALGHTPQGFRSPSGDTSPMTLELVEEHGLRYDSSLMADDLTPYRPRIGDEVDAQTALRPGREAAFWELPMSFELDDWPHFQFAFGPYRQGLSSPSKVLEIWQAEVDWMVDREGGGVLTVAMHPQVIGRGHRMAMLERFIEHARARGCRFARMADVAAGLPASSPAP
jgi:peptidoglycan-N-acetylglucosamine deacetylase